MQVEVGSVLEGKVTGITNFGAFVRLPDGKQGLVHISEVASEYVKDIHDHLEENQTVKVKVLSKEPNGRVCLSIKRAQDPKPKRVTKAPPKVGRPCEIDWTRDDHRNLSFEEKMSKFKTDSEERILEFKKSIDSKHGGGYRRSANTY